MLSINRVSDIQSIVDDSGPETNIYANNNIKLEPSALVELEKFRTICGIEKISITPDFHKGSGTPIGTTALIDRVYPKVVGGDIGCGLRFDVTNLSDLVVTDKLKNDLRNAFFNGHREIFVKDRRDILAYGLQATLTGKSVSRIPKINKNHANGALGYGDVTSLLNSYTDNKSNIDNILGTVGGGNHFVEIQRVTEIVNRHAAYAAGIKHGSICIMSHSGSLDIGHVVANYHGDRAKELHIGSVPDHKYLSLSEKDGLRYIIDSYNAANFAMVNRAVMNSMVADILDTELNSVYDSPHNLVWYDESSNKYLHRKGSCPAHDQEIVMLPGSMETRSCIAIGHGFAGTMSSSAHGAGRVLNRNAARSSSDIIKKNPHVVTKIDIGSARPDIAKELTKSLNEESGRAYKDVKEVVSTSEEAGIFSVVAWLEPILTIKG